MSLTQIVIALRARWRSALLAFVAVVAAAAVLTATAPRLYTATASVVLDVKSADPIAGLVMPALAIAGYMATQGDVIQSERVLIRALRDLALDKDAALQAQWRAENGGKGHMLAWLAERTLRGFQVLPSKESNVITVSYKATDPDAAAAMLNAVVKAYIATTIELRADPARQYDAFFDDRARHLRSAVEQAQARLSDYRRQAGVVASDERYDVETARLAELSTQLVAAQVQAGESGSRQQLARTQADNSPEVLASPLVGALATELARQQARLDQLRISQGEQHPEVKAATAGIAQLQAQITAETRKVTASIDVNNSVNVTRVGQLRAALEAQRARVLELKGQRDQAAVLQRDVDNATQAYSAAFARFSQANMESQSTQTNVSILKAASPPARPSSPRAAVNLAVAAVLGALLAVATALLCESRNARLRVDDDVTLQLRQRLLGALPDGGRRHRASGQFLRLTASTR